MGTKSKDRGRLHSRGKVYLVFDVFGKSETKKGSGAAKKKPESVTVDKKARPDAAKEPAPVLKPQPVNVPAPQHSGDSNENQCRLCFSCGYCCRGTLELGHTGCTLIIPPALNVAEYPPRELPLHLRLPPRGRPFSPALHSPLPSPQESPEIVVDYVDFSRPSYDSIFREGVQYEPEYVLEPHPAYVSRYRY